MDVDGSDPPSRGKGTADAAAAPIRVLIADDHAVFRRGIRVILDHAPDIEVVGEAADADAAEAAEASLEPDVILMDVRMPGGSGIEAAERIKSRQPDAAILMLTASEDESDLFEAIKAGATGYLLKEISVEEVCDAVRAAAAGQSRLAPRMASKLLSEFAMLSQRGAETDAGSPARLTDREMDVLRLMAKGQSNREIAKELFISENTVKNHVRNILEKLHLHSRMEAVVYAVREKLLEIT
jgi:two-component system NarL family response regulator